MTACGNAHRAVAATLGFMLCSWRQERGQMTRRRIGRCTANRPSSINITLHLGRFIAAATASIPAVAAMKLSMPRCSLVFVSGMAEKPISTPKSTRVSGSTIPWAWQAFRAARPIRWGSPRLISGCIGCSCARPSISAAAGDPVAAGANQLAGAHTEDNLVITAGKFSVTDIFDANTYAHDPRGDFLNWSIIDSGAYDYAADSWGYSYGIAGEWTQSWWTVRAGLFDLSRNPNVPALVRGFGQYELVAEAETRHTWWGEPGKLKLLGYSIAAGWARITTR